MAEAAVFFALEKLEEFIRQEITQPLYGTRERVKHLQDELERIRCFLKDADARRYESKRLHNWIASIREAAYDAEDAIEAFILKVSHREGKGFKGFLRRFACIPREVMICREVGSEIERIITRLSNLAESMHQYGIREVMDNESSTSSQNRQREKRQTFPHIIEHNVVGLEQNIEELATSLVDEGKQFQIASICGMGGVGKTTLAKLVFHNCKVRRHFEHFAWVYVSQQCIRRSVWQELLLNLCPKDEKHVILDMRDEELAVELYQFLKNNKCLVVLDDVWSVDAWDSVKHAFPTETGSKILLTSRNREVGPYADPRGILHEPRCLSHEESWKLLQKIAFLGKDGMEIDARVKELGKQMVKQCGGLPLAITVLGGLLATKHSLNQWQIVEEDIKSYISRGNSYGHETSSVFDVLSLSYDDLPPHLKQCFLYLAHFPEDYRIEAQKLIKYWVAEGMIVPVECTKGDDGGTMEDVAEGYLEELVKRSMVLVGGRDVASSRIGTCHVHDLLRDLCLSKAKEEIYLQVICSQPYDKHIDDLFPLSSADKIRRLAVHLEGAPAPAGSENNSFSHKQIRSSRIRSLLYITKALYGEWVLTEPMFGHLMLLRVLDLEGAQIQKGKLPKDIGKLIHLRYLSLRGCKVSKLPLSLGNLRLLLTLDLLIHGRVFVPDVIRKMQRLRHLHLPFGLANESKLRLGNLRNLQTLENFPVGICDVRDLLNMMNLRRLSISLYPKSKDFRTMISACLSSKLKRLQALSLTGSQKYWEEDFPTPFEVTPMVSDFSNLLELYLLVKIQKLPYAHQFPCEITSIGLGKCTLLEDPMLVLEMLPNLRTLVLFDNAFVRREVVCSKNGFQQLRFLTFSHLEDMEEWIVKPGAMPNLMALEITFCHKLEMLPHGLKHVRMLQELKIRFMKKSFKDRLVPSGEDFYKIRHVSSVIFHCCE